MNHKTKETQVVDMLAQLAKGKHRYIAPKFEAIEVDEMKLICTSPSVSPSAPGFNEDDWGSENPIDDGDENEFE